MLFEHLQQDLQRLVQNALQFGHRRVSTAFIMVAEVFVQNSLREGHYMAVLL